MSNQDKRARVVNRLRLISAKAAVLADDLERDVLWEGELGHTLRELTDQIQKALTDAQR